MPGLSALGRDQPPPSLLLRNTEGAPAAKGLRGILRHVQLRPRTKVPRPAGSTFLQPTPQASGWCRPQLFLSTSPAIIPKHTASASSPLHSNLITRADSTIHSLLCLKPTRVSHCTWNKIQVPGPRGPEISATSLRPLGCSPPVGTTPRLLHLPPPWPQCDRS